MMEKPVFKRVCAYIIDIAIVSFIFMLFSKIELLISSSYMEGMVLYKVQILILPSSLIILLSKMWGDKLVQLSPPNMGVQAGSKECKSLYSL